MKTLPAARRGFSLVEVLLVVAIAGILASIAIPSFLGFARRAKVAERKIIFEAVRRDVYLTYSQNGKWPWGAGPGATEWNPPLPSNGAYTREKWVTTEPTWAGIGFATEQPVYCRYLVHSGTPETVMYLDARCDLDSDGDACTYSEGFSMERGAPLNCVSATPDAECAGHVPVSGTTFGDNDCGL